MINKVTAIILYGILMSVSINTAAALRQYKAQIENSDWQLKDKSRLQCTLSHRLPGYGKAMFNSVASKQLNMEFELDMLLLPKSYGVAAVYSIPPKWMPGQIQRTIADMPMRKQFNGDLPEQVAWIMLTELEKVFGQLSIIKIGTTHTIGWLWD